MLALTKTKINQKRLAKRATWLLLLWLFFIFLFFGFSKGKKELAWGASDSNKDKIEDLKDEIDEMEEAEMRISNQIESINQNIAVIESQLKKTQEVVNQLNQELERLDQEISEAEKKISKQKEVLADAIVKMNAATNEIQLIFWKEREELKNSFG